MLRCSAIIVTYNSAGSVTACLEALAPQECEIVVVDNASEDDTVARVQAFADRHAVQFLRISRNLGFAGGVNHGARAASGDVLLLLNPDAIAEPEAIEAITTCLDRTGAVAVGGALLGSDGEPEKGFAFRRFPTLSILLCEVLLLNQIWRNNPVNRRYRCLDADYSRQQFVEQPAGACLAIRRDAWDRLGGMDTQFGPVWFEDVDLCKRLLESCGRIVYCPAARFHHTGAHSVGRLNFQNKQLFWYGNMLRYARKHFPAWKVVLLRIGIMKGMVLRAVAVLLGKGPPGIAANDAIRAYRQVMRLALRGLEY